MVTFSTILTQIAQEEKMNMQQMLSFLQNKGVETTYTSLTSYRSFRSIPSYDIAKSILEAFNYDISELPDILENSRTELKNYKEDTGKKFVRTIRIKPEELNVDTADEITIVLEQRAREENYNVNQYIINLIKNDLILSKYIKGE